MARPSRRGRELDGVILVDKPLGMSSNDLLQKVKRLFDAKRAGHTGALDPLASGMLPVCLGEATKFSQYLLDADKRYLVTAKLGIRTETSDVEGEVISVRPVVHTHQDLIVAVNAFLGETEQIPSIYSALKYQGRPLYEYARQGIEVPRVSRPIYVYSIDIINIKEDEVTLDIHCSKGTYIRTIIDDLGEALKCGAHVTQLHRIAVGNYPADKMINWFDLLELAQPGFVSAKPALITDEHDHAFEAGSNIKFKLTYELHPLEKQARFDRIDTLLLPLDTPAAGFDAVYLSEQASLAFSKGVSVQFFAKDSDALAHAKNHRSNMVVDGLPAAGFKRVFNQISKQFLGVGHLSESSQLWPKRVVVLPEALSEASE